MRQRHVDIVQACFACHLNGMPTYVRDHATLSAGGSLMPNARGSRSPSNIQKEYALLCCNLIFVEQMGLQASLERSVDLAE